MINDDNGMIEPQSPGLPSMMSREGEAMITGDLERDLGFI
jgi:hypothetical protein